jgi:Glycosyl hydrolase family 71
MLIRASAAIIATLLVFHGCSEPVQPIQLKYQAAGRAPELLTVYEAWFGEPNHISVGYSSHDVDEIRRQIDEAKAMGISAFVVDWYGDRDQYIDQSYALLQKQAAKNNFRVAMMYDQSNEDDGATDEIIADFTMFHDTYLQSNSPGHEAYLTFDGRPVIFVFPHGKSADWDKVRVVVNRWNVAPLLIDENLPGDHADAFDGFYPWINPGPQGWSADGSHWGDQYLGSFYQTMGTKYANKIVVGSAWPQFDDSKASWGLNRHISARCGQTFQDTFNYWRKVFPANQVIPFVLIETWNDYEEGSAIEPGLPTCGNQPAPKTLETGDNGASASTAQR